MKNITFKLFLLALAAVLLARCNSDDSLSVNGDGDENAAQLVDVAQTSGQLASGTSFRISGSSTDSIGTHPSKDRHGHHKPYRGILDGVNLLAPTNELLAIVDAESAGDFRGLRIAGYGGATITHYNAEGKAVTLSAPKSGGPNGCSFSGKQFPEYDSLLSKIVKTVIDFGAGVTFKRDSVSITRSGKIIISRTGDASSKTEITTFEDYFVNGAKIEGTKTRISTYDATTGSGTSTTAVADGRITFADGTVTTWTSDRQRTSNITFDETTGRPVSGTIETEVNTAVTAVDGTVTYSHKTTAPLVENIACEKRKYGPVSGTLETIYGDDTVIVDFGDGSCNNRTITITINGVTTTKTIGG
jgi:hypothetical protein